MGAVPPVAPGPDEGAGGWAALLAPLGFTSLYIPYLPATLMSSADAHTLRCDSTSEASSDAALGECMDTRKSRLGTLVIVNGAFLTGKSARLKRVVTSSTGAEVYALSAAAREMVAVRNQLRELPL